MADTYSGPVHTAFGVYTTTSAGAPAVRLEEAEDLPLNEINDGLVSVHVSHNGDDATSIFLGVSALDEVRARDIWNRLAPILTAAMAAGVRADVPTDGCVHANTRSLCTDCGAYPVWS